MFDRILIVRLSSFGDVALTLPLRVAFVAKGPQRAADACWKKSPSRTYKLAGEEKMAI